MLYSGSIDIPQQPLLSNLDLILGVMTPPGRQALAVGLGYSLGGWKGRGRGGIGRVREWWR